MNIQGQKGLQIEIEGLGCEPAARLAVKMLLQAFVYYLQKFYLNADQIFYLEVQLILCLGTLQRKMNIECSCFHFFMNFDNHVAYPVIWIRYASRGCRSFNNLFRDPSLINQCKITKLPWDKKLHLRSCNWLLTEQKGPALHRVFGREGGRAKAGERKGKKKKQAINQTNIESFVN